MPTVSVVMPVYNAKAFLTASVESILEQTFTDFEFIIVDDGSTDSSRDILIRYGKTDGRICLYQQENQGLVFTLNRCIQLAKGKYIVRMDADDVSLPPRLSTQVRFMESHKEVGICGTWIKTFGGKRGVIQKYPISDNMIRGELMFRPPLAHPSVIMRRDTLIDAHLTYQPEFRYAEDYDFWLRSSYHTRFANIPKTLLLHRIHPQQVSLVHAQPQLEATWRVQQHLFEKLGITPTSDERTIHQAVCTMKIVSSKDFIHQIEDWLLKLRSANQTSRVFPEKAFSTILGTYWFFACHKAVRRGWWTWKTYQSSPLSMATGVEAWKRIAMAILCILHLRSG